MSITNMSERATCWSVTINNPGKNDEEFIAMARQKGWKVEGQLEKGENGTPHYQLIVRTPQVRFSAVKKAFPRAHIEVARNPTALASYVKKSETREGDLPQTESKFPSLGGFYKLLIPRLHNLDDKHLRVHFDGGWYDNSVSRDHEQRMLDALDQGASELIRMGFHVETLVVNPQTRSAWKRFGMEIIDRTIAEMSADRQTDRQTVNISVAESITSDDGENTEGDDEGDSQGEEEGDEGEYGSCSDPDEECDEESSVAGESDLEPDGGD